MGVATVCNIQKALGLLLQIFFPLLPSPAHMDLVVDTMTHGPTPYVARLFSGHLIQSLEFQDVATSTAFPPGDETGILPGTYTCHYIIGNSTRIDRIG
jgi:hypothetical protein